MTERLVCDASAVIALLTDAGPGGTWATAALSGAALAAPTLLAFECANVLRRLERAGRLGPDQAAQAHADLLALPVEPWPYAVLGTRVWELRTNLSSYDASYVALAELVDARLVTLDQRLAQAPGLRCVVITPEGSAG